VNGYPATETGTICQLFMDHDTILIIERLPVGYPVENLSVQIYDEKKQEIDNSLGELVVEGESVALGYRDPAKNKLILSPTPYMKPGTWDFSFPMG
jgi:non-ribosomal peptide synthetase component F